ncbi:MAG TPA: N-6 DNA methylase [Candidatus Bathyarchaeia archaeon]|nr:N-6 DNA methylase [Candidatus Bathyarchaeia archaeon]
MKTTCQPQWMRASFIQQQDCNYKHMGENKKELPFPRRKALGQYFTDKHIAELLGNLAATDKRPTNILDPMAGQGDMLFGAYSVFGKTPKYLGLEIDKDVIKNSQNRIPKGFPGKIIQGNSFEASLWRGLGNIRFDLVITNPPYVRYQSQKEASKMYGLPGIEAVRTGLSKILNQYYSVRDQEHSLFKRLIEGYSGLSDLAVPAWILCGMLTKIGGTLAMIVPESWLSRDYASPISWMLLKLFRIMFVVEDSSRTWFGETQVKTTLLVAQRIEFVDNPIAFWAKKSFVYAKSKERLIDVSPISKLYKGSSNPNAEFAKDMYKLLGQKEKDQSQVPFAFEIRQFGNEVLNTLARLNKNKRLSKTLLTGKEQNSHKNRPFVPHSLKGILTANFDAFTTFAELGVDIGQGLRTGANDFFYLKIVENRDRQEPYLVRTSQLFGSALLEIPKEIAKPVFRFQSDLPESWADVDINFAKWILLDLDDYALPDDIQRAYKSNSTLVLRDLSALIPEVANYVTAAAKTRIGQEKGKAIPELSAVRTNVNYSKGRFWYTLPPLQNRHVPDVLIPRVNSRTPRAWLNRDRALIVDANFSTAWIKKEAKIDVYGLLALFNSVTVKASMELTGSVMGAGALKLEATHLREIPVPKLTFEQIRELSIVGKKLLLRANQGKEQSNSMIDNVLVGNRIIKEYLREMNSISFEHLSNRTKGLSL